MFSFLFVGCENEMLQIILNITKFSNDECLDDWTQNVAATTRVSTIAVGSFSKKDSRTINGLLLHIHWHKLDTKPVLLFDSICESYLLISFMNYYSSGLLDSPYPVKWSTLRFLFVSTPQDQLYGLGDPQTSTTAKAKADIMTKSISISKGVDLSVAESCTSTSSTWSKLCTWFSHSRDGSEQSLHFQHYRLRCCDHGRFLVSSRGLEGQAAVSRDSGRERAILNERVGSNIPWRQLENNTSRKSWSKRMFPGEAVLRIRGSGVTKNYAIKDGDLASVPD